MYNLQIKKTQQKNPYLRLKHIKHQLSEDLIYDFYLKVQKCGIIFLSFKYHQTKPLYVRQKIMDTKNLMQQKQNHQEDFLFLALIEDVEDANIFDIQMICLESQVKLLVFRNQNEFTSFFKKLYEDTSRIKNRYIPQQIVLKCIKKTLCQSKNINQKKFTFKICLYKRKLVKVNF